MAFSSAGRRWSRITLGVAAATSVIVAFAPLGSSSSCVATEDGESTCTTDTTSLVETEGMSVLLVLAVPILLAAIPLVFRSPRVARWTAILLTVAGVIAAASIGMFLIPTILLAWVAATRGRDAE